MFRKSPDGDYDDLSENGVRHLFRLGPYEFQDTLDEDGRFHHFLLEGEGGSEEDGERTAYEVDGEIMRELMARYLAGEYEKAEYDLERSPGHDALLDLLEIATARARAGETEFAFEDLDHEETEILDAGEDDNPAHDRTPGG
ncbi:MAG TPA: hypothetical protein VFS20_06625 [Longimicrobium sp.]|nr:hypothetical protein [Longimicrobium sp.]